MRGQIAPAAPLLPKAAPRLHQGGFGAHRAGFPAPGAARPAQSPRAENKLEVVPCRSGGCQTRCGSTGAQPDPPRRYDDAVDRASAHLTPGHQRTRLQQQGGASRAASPPDSICLPPRLRRWPGVDRQQCPGRLGPRPHVQPDAPGGHRTSRPPPGGSEEA